MAESGRSGYGRRLPPVAAAFLAVLALGLLAGCRQQAAAPTVEPDAPALALYGPVGAAPDRDALARRLAA